jgi:hypothetical protein
MGEDGENVKMDHPFITMKNLFKYLVAAIIIVIPLYPKFPFIHIPGTYVSIRFEDFLLAIIGLLTLIKIIPNIKKFFSDNIARAMLVFLLIGSVSVFAGIYLTQTVVPTIGILHLLRRVEYFIPFFAVLAFFPHEGGKNLEFYIKVLMLTVFVVLLYGVGQKYFNLPVIMTQDSEVSKGIALRWTSGSQLTSTFAGHYDLAAFAVLVLPIFISLIFVVKGKLSKIFLLLASISGYWLLVNTASRISFGSYLIAVSIALLLIKKYKAIVAVVIISLVMSSFSASLFGRYKSLIDVYLQKVKSVKIVDARLFDFRVTAQEIVSPTTVKTLVPTPTPKPIIEDRSTSIRFNVEWPRAVRALMKSPLIGTGYSSVGLAIDNDYLRLLAEVGILGFLAFVLIIVRIMLIFVSQFPITKKLSGIELGFVAGVIGGLFGILVNAVFIDVFESSKFAIIFWLLIGLAVYSLKGRSYEQEN